MKRIIEKIYEFFEYQVNTPIVKLGESMGNSDILRYLGALIWTIGVAMSFFNTNAFAIVGGILGWF